MKRAPVFLSLVALIIMALPVLVMPFVRAQPQRGDQPEAPMPRLIGKDGQINGKLAQDFDSWLLGQLGFKSQLVCLNALVNYKLFRTSTNDDVIVGRDGMLFYRETVDDYSGASALKTGELSAIQKNIARLAQSLEARGARLYVAIVPNKSSVYPDRMPISYERRLDGGNIDRVNEALRAAGARVIDLLPVLKAASQDERTYHLTDTHWNDVGAHAAAEAILSEMGKPCVAPTVRRDALYSGDLARMLGLEGVLNEQTTRLVQESPTDGPGPDYSARNLLVPGDGEGALLLLRDSFGSGIAPFITPAYETSRLRWEDPFEATQPADDVLIAIAERNIRLYLAQGITCIAPPVALDLSDAKALDLCAVTAHEDSGCVSVELELDGVCGIADAYISMGGQIYWAAEMPDYEGGDNPQRYQALLPLDEVDLQAPVRAIALGANGAAFVSGCQWTLDEWVSPDWETEGDDEDDFETLQQLRRQLSAGGDADGI